MKKNKNILLFICFLSISFFWGCVSKTVKTKNFEYANKFYLTDDSTKGALNLIINVEIPVNFSNKTVLDSVRNKILLFLFGENYVNMPLDSVIPAFVREQSSDYRNNNLFMLNTLNLQNYFAFNNDHILEGFSLWSDENIFSYGIKRYVFMGGAHGLSTQTFLNFDLKTGKTLTEKDLFIPDYKEKLTTLIRERLIEENDEISEYRDLNQTDYWVDSIQPNGNFYISDEGINYLFNPYEIGPYYLGETEVRIPYARLKDILKNGNPLEYLYENR
ncbi:MAG: hypothetical protein BWZ11_00452 [Bacteroidetes bacterium ADurb.BinA395]|jgi:hypothetical protein|nr:MAG: hypothetical protein BWZ11_00452 [Bacteroidetes bacterium ADurb.BinA395]